MVIFGWLVFDEKGFIKKYDPLLWLLIPVLYFVYIVVRAETGVVFILSGSRYPYYFMDTDINGWPYVFKNIGILTLVLTAVGYGIYFIDNFIGRATGRFKPKV